MTKKKEKQSSLDADPRFSKIVGCEVSPTNNQIIDSKIAKDMAHLPTVDFYERKNVNLDIHSVVVEEYHKIGDQIIIKGYEVITREVVAVIDCKKRTSRLKISTTELNFSRH